MTREELDKLQNLQKEINVIKMQISSIDIPFCHDKVVGSDSVFPYTKRSFTVKGYDFDSYYAKLDRLNKKLEKKLNDLMDERDKITSFIETIEDPMLRMILTLKHINGLTWEQIGTKIGYSPRQCRRKYKNFIERMESERK